MQPRLKLFLLVVTACLPLGSLALAGTTTTANMAVTFAGGHDIGDDDHGRPCVLIAAALGVKPEVFREAFSGVTPAKNGRPSGDEARKNKIALLKVLGPHGVTNDRLDEVSNHYRFKPQDGELWKHTDAKAHAVVEAGKITKIVLDEPGAGYSTSPTVTIKGFEKVECVVTLKFDKNLKQNGSIKSIEVKKEKPPA